MEIKREIKFDNNIISFDELGDEAIFKRLVDRNIQGKFEPINFKYHKLKTGKLFLYLKGFDGYRFLDNNNNFYDLVENKIYFRNGLVFIGDKDKAFSLFNNYDKMQLKLKETIEKRKNEDEAEKTRIEDEFCEELKKELDNFDFKNIELKNGKYMYP